jgi:glucose/arabinose dehydrogenase
VTIPTFRSSGLSHGRALYARVLLIPVLLLLLPIFGSPSAVAVQTQPALPFEDVPPGAKVETVLDGMHQPVAIAFDPSGRIFYTERDTGNVRLFANGTLQDSPVITFKVDSFDEHGLLGITVDPDFQSNHYVYVYYICAVGDDCPAPASKVVRFVEHNGVGSEPVTIFTSPNTRDKHVAGGIHFGPDGKLYISIGDNLNAANAQDLTVPNGKILRINSDGTIPDDGPSFGQDNALRSIYAIGMRNSFDFTFDPLYPGRIFAAENGPTCDDELNRIEAGYNYGWRPNYPCDDNNPDPNFNSIPPLFYLGRGSCCDAPTGVAIYTGDQVSEWKGHLFMSSYNNGALYHFVLDESHTSLLSSAIVRDVKANITVANGPDGALYYIELGGKQDGILKRVVAAPQVVTPTATPTPSVSPEETPTPAPIVPATIPGDGTQAFPETGEVVSGIFLDYWRQNGDVARQGYPISGPMTEVSELNGESYAVQYFERSVFEYHPEIEDPRYKVLLSQLGTFQYKKKYPDGAPNQKPNTEAGSVLFKETGKRVGGKFLQYWNEQGGLTQLGYPISDEFTEVSDLNGKPYLVQYFERAVFEYHPKKEGTPYEVLLSQLGTFEYKWKYGH